MSAQPHEESYMTETEYLRFVDEDTSDIRYEYVNGEIYAMTGATLRHNIITSNINRIVGTQLADKSCFVTTSDTRVNVSEKLSYRYPDIVVVCGKPEFVENREDTVTNPIVLVEVLSPSTTVIDYNQKLEEYTHLPSLQEYLIVSQDKFKVERFLRQTSGDWLYSQALGLDSMIHLPSIDCKLALANVYSKLDLLDDE